MKKWIMIAKEAALAGSLLMMTARLACVGGVIGAATYFCQATN